MNCPNCGAKIAEGDAYCPFCGIRLSGQTGPEKAPWETAQQADGAWGNPQQQEGVSRRPVSPYYQQQFEAVRGGGRVRFNWAAFFLGAYHALYRGHTKRFLLLYLPVMLASALGQIGVFCALRSQSMFQLGAAFLVNGLITLVSLGIAIYNGATFNRSYFSVCRGDPRVPRHGGRTVAAVAVVAVFSLVMTLIISGALAAQFLRTNGIGFQERAPYFDQFPADSSASQHEQGEHTGGREEIDGLLEAYAQIPEDQLYLFGWCDPLAVDEEERLNSIFLFRSDKVSLIDAFSAVSQDLSWNTVELEEPLFGGDSYYYEVYCSLEEGDICFDVAAGGGNVLIFGCYVWQGEEYAGLNEQQASALLEAIYARAGAQQSLAQQMRGRWENGDGQELVIDGIYFNGQPYYLWFVDDDILAIYLENVEGTEGEYFMMMDDTVLNVWQYDEDDNIINDLYYLRAE